jgi:hypothetical protein
MKVHEFTKLENKLGLKTRNSGDRLAWFEYQGKAVTYTKRSHGNKDLPENLIRQQLKVNESQFAGLLSCSVTLDEYVEILKRKKIITASPKAATGSSTEQSPPKPTH